MKVKRIGLIVLAAVLGSLFLAAGNADWITWIKANHSPLRSLWFFDGFSDLQFLKSVLGDRTIVQLGESAHGVAEFDKAKVRLIRFLHEEMGFNVIAFESSIFECDQADRQARDLKPEDIMGRSIFGVWHTEEVLELFRYLKLSKNTAHPLILAGFDVQTSSTSGLSKRPDAFAAVISPLDPAYADFVLAKDQEFIQMMRSSSWSQILTTRKDEFKSYYQALTDWLDVHLEELVDLFPGTPPLPLILRQTAWSMGPYIDELTSDYPEDYNFRDRGMAENIAFLAERAYPGEKIMIWAHNFHIQHDAGAVLEYPGIVNMGSWVVQRFRPRLYTIGLLMYEGEAAWNNRFVYHIPPAAEGTVEAILNKTGRSYAFVDLLHRTFEPGNSWMFGPMILREWGLYSRHLIPRDQFDGLLFIRTTHAPRYVTYYGFY